MSGMRLQLLRPPPIATLKPCWRELYEQEAFAQREMIGESRLRSVTKERDVSLGIGPKSLEELDLAGAVQPIAFAEEGYMPGFSSPAHPADLMRFKDESEPRPWPEYEWESDLEPQFPQVTPLYSPWQQLYVDDAAKGTYRELSLEILIAEPEERERQLEGLRDWAINEDAAWRSLDQRWDALIKLLVAIQNRYWRDVNGRVALIPDLKGDSYLVAGPDQEQTSAVATLKATGASIEEVSGAYYFLVERGLERDPRDGLTLLRRARPRAFHLRWQGLPRRAQDNFDAAELLRRFLIELTGENPPRPDMWPIDGRQIERAAIYARGPGGPWTAEEIKEELLAAELYPHGVHLIGEGESEWIVTSRLVEALLGSKAVGEIDFFDLGGSGGASYVEPLSTAFSEYAVRAVVIVDREGQMADYVGGAIKRGRVAEEDVMLFEDSLEASNASAEELIELIRQIATTLEVEPESIAFELDGAEMDAIHKDRRERSSGTGKGLAEDLLAEIRKRTEGRLDIDKSDLAEALAEHLVEEIEACDPADLEALKEKRPVIGFVIDRVIEALNRPRPAGSQP
jgi:hypothetical protein